MRILLTCALGRTAKSVVEMLRDNPAHEEAYIVGVDMNRDEEKESYYDAFYQVSRIAMLPTYINQLIDICEEERIDVLLPWSVLEIEGLFLNQNRFKNTKILLPSPMDAAITLGYKDFLYPYLEIHNYPTLEYEVVSKDSIEEANEFLANRTNKEWMLKIGFGEGGRGVSIIPKGTTSITLPDDDIYVIQERVNDRYPYKFDALTLSGECISSYVRKDLWEDKIIESEIIDCPDFSNMCKGLIKEFNYSGLINIQSYKINGEYYIVDINPRAWGPIAISYVAGGNILWWAIEQLMYGEIKTLTEHKVGTKYNPYPKREAGIDNIPKDKRDRLYTIV